MKHSILFHTNNPTQWQWLILIIFAILSVVGWADEAEIDNYFDLSIEELMNLEIASSSTLIQTTRRLTPQAVVTIEKEDIQSSGARSLYDLLNIYVPNFHIIRNQWETMALGLRGTSGNSALLLLINGRVINDRAHAGAFSEIELPMLNDIHHIDVVRGSGSAVYGQGALSMVINVITESGLTFQGTEIKLRTGAIEEFYSTEIKHGRKFSDDKGLYLYLGMDKYLGADQTDAPFVSANTYTDIWGGQTVAGQAYDAHDIPNDGGAFRDMPRIKAHVQYNDGPLELWARYSKGGSTNPYGQTNLAFGHHGELGWFNPSWALGSYPSYDDLYKWPGNGYQQITLNGQYTQEVSDTLDIKYTVGYETHDYVRTRWDWNNPLLWPSSGSPYLGYVENYRSEQFMSKAQANWDINDQHKVAFGGEWTHERFGLPTLGWPGADDVYMQPWEEPYPPDPAPQWDTDTYSLFLEHQWLINKQWSIIWGGRVDYNDFSERLVSPRFGAIYTPTDKDTVKLTASKAMRLPQAEWAKKEWDENGSKTDAEALKAYEVRYERQQTDNLFFAATAFYQEADKIDWDNSTYSLIYTGLVKTYGLELEMMYHKDNLRLSMSHGYTKLADFELAAGAATSQTAAAYGFGNDLADWHNHISKFRAKYDFSDKLSLDGSMQIYWGIPGARDYAAYQNSIGNQSLDPDYYGIYKPSYFLNLGVEYKPSENTTVRLDGYNLLGFIDKDYNKILYTHIAYSDCRSVAPAFGVSLTHKF